MTTQPKKKKDIMQRFKERLDQEKKMLDDRYPSDAESAKETDLERQQRLMNTPSAWTN